MKKLLDDMALVNVNGGFDEKDHELYKKLIDYISTHGSSINARRPKKDQ